MAEPISGYNKLSGHLLETRLLMEQLCMKIQHKFCNELEDKKFIVDHWTCREGGGGITCVLQDGKRFEKAGMHISVVHSSLPSMW